MVFLPDIVFGLHVLESFFGNCKCNDLRLRQCIFYRKAAKHIVDRVVIYKNKCFIGGHMLNVILKVVPVFIALRILIVPPSVSTWVFTMNRPIPFPSMFV